MPQPVMCQMSPCRSTLQIIASPPTTGQHETKSVRHRVDELFVTGALPHRVLPKIFKFTINCAHSEAQLSALPA